MWLLQKEARFSGSPLESKSPATAAFIVAQPLRHRCCPAHCSRSCARAAGDFWFMPRARFATARSFSLLQEFPVGQKLHLLASLPPDAKLLTDEISYVRREAQIFGLRTPLRESWHASARTSRLLFLPCSCLRKVCRTTLSRSTLPKLYNDCCGTFCFSRTTRVGRTCFSGGLRVC